MKLFLCQITLDTKEKKNYPGVFLWYSYKKTPEIKGPKNEILLSSATKH